MRVVRNICGKFQRANTIITKADKDSTVVINKNTYTNKVHDS